MYKSTRIKKSPREHFMREAENEFSKFERNERAFRQAEREERAAVLRLPIDRKRTPTSSDTRQ
jgi:hypothetical protein